MYTNREPIWEDFVLSYLFPFYIMHCDKKWDDENDNYFPEQETGGWTYFELSRCGGKCTLEFLPIFFPVVHKKCNIAILRFFSKCKLTCMLHCVFVRDCCEWQVTRLIRRFTLLYSIYSTLQTLKSNPI